MSEAISGVLQVKDVMTSPVITVKPEMDLLEAVMLMNNHRIGSLVVVRDKRPIGIVTERDIMTKVVGKEVVTRLKVSDVMSTPILSLREGDLPETATKVMTEHRIKRLPVVNEDGDLVGIITSTDLVREIPHMVGLLTKQARLG